MIFKVIFEESKRILKLNDFWIKNVVLTTTLWRERFKIMIHKVKVKNMFLNVKNEETKTIKKVDVIMHSELQMKEMKWFSRENNKKKYALMIIWVRDVKTANKLIQLKLIMKSNVKTMKYYEKNYKIMQCMQCQKYKHWIYIYKLNNIMHIARASITRQNTFIRKMQRNENEIYTRIFIKHSILNVLKNKWKKE